MLYVHRIRNLKWRVAAICNRSELLSSRFINNLYKMCAQMSISIVLVQNDDPIFIEAIIELRCIRVLAVYFSRNSVMLLIAVVIMVSSFVISSCTLHESSRFVFQSVVPFLMLVKSTIIINALLLRCCYDLDFNGGAGAFSVTRFDDSSHCLLKP